MIERERSASSRLLKLLIATTLAVSLNTVSAANRTADKVTGLPGCAPLPSKWYSGYLNVSSTKSLHYIFIESLDKPSNDPILIWFNGGPGCSSMLGLFQEHGPYIFDDGETVIKPNPYPWNVRANLLYIESPAGVGFSWGNGSDAQLHSDMSTSQDAFVGLQNFYQSFPDYRNNSLYITGESYAGVYAPYLAWQIHEWNLVQNMNNWNDTYNLKGFIIGNGVTDMYIDSDSQMIESLANWNMIPSALWNQIQQAGCIFYWDKLDVKANNPPQCQGLYDQAMDLI